MEGKPIDKLEIRVKGRMFVDKQFETGTSVKITLEGVIKKLEIEDNDDGTVSLCHIVWPNPPNAIIS